MAKRGRKAGPDGKAATSGVGTRASAMEGFAEDLGRLLGSARAKAEGWLGQRTTVARQLEQIRDTAAGLLTQLTGGPERRRPGRARTPQPVVPMGTLPERRPRRKLSAKARKAISDAQKKRWAKVKGSR